MDELWLPVARIAALRAAILKEQPVTLDDDIDLSPLKLARKAAQTLWNELPLHAIADAHRKEAECLVARGNPDSTAINNAAVLVKYYKYLQLYPNKNSPEYKAACARVHILERAIDGTAESGVDYSIPVNDAQHVPAKWSFFILGVITATIVPCIVKKVSAARKN
ncbi:hypothetical protein C8R47DRAFT_1158461 [Mycena vitilis]|nr:hypothetical protein C8R47DRAFT_1158461 [Mycena vitilis]